VEIKDVEKGQVVKFTTRVDKSSKDEEIQNVEMRVEKVTDTLITGINANRILDGTQSSLPYRTYKITNIVPNTFWVRLA
jgi:hypothetical protein